ILILVFGRKPQDAATAELLHEIRQLLSTREQRRVLWDPPARQGDARAELPPQPAAPEDLPRDKTGRGWPKPFAGLEADIKEARHTSDSEREFRLLLKATNELRGPGHLDAALEAAQRMVGLAKAKEAWPPIAFGQLGLVYLRLGQADKALVEFEQAERIY